MVCHECPPKSGFGGFAPNPKRQRGKDSRTKRPPDPETKVETPGAGGVRVAHGRSEVRRNVEPGTAADEMATAITRFPRRAIRGRPVVVSVIAVLDPLPDIAVHVIEAERRGRE